MVSMMTNEGMLTAMVHTTEPHTHALRGRVADVGGGVEGDGPRGALGNGHDVREFAHADPAVRFHHVVLDEGKHGIAPAESE